MNYVKHAMWHDVLEPWIEVVNDEWGEAHIALLQAYGDTDMWDDAQYDTMLEWLRDSVTAMWETGDYGAHYHDYVDEMRFKTDEAIKEWRKTAEGLRKLETWRETLDNIPTWMRDEQETLFDPEAS